MKRLWYEIHRTFQDPLLWLILFYIWFFQLAYNVFRGAGPIEVCAALFLSLTTFSMWRSLK